MSIPEIIIERIQYALGVDKAALHEPSFNRNEWNYTKDCLDTGWVSSVGSYVDSFERNLVDFIGIGHAVVVSNGTSALHVALELAGVQANEEVLIPALTFVATANAVKHCGAIPHFVDSDRLSLGMNVAALEDYLSEIVVRRSGFSVNRHTGMRIAAIVPMHTFGHPVDMPALMALSERYCIPVVEDAAESLGSRIGSQHTGTFGLCGVVSFNGNKIITTGGGGCIITNDAALAKRAKHITTTAKLPHAWAFIHDEVGYNFRMPNINAALGCAQLEQIDDFLAAKRSLATRYRDAFANVEGVSLFTERSGTTANYWLQTLLLDEDVADQRDDVLNATNRIGLMTRPVWDLLPSLQMYSSSPSMDIPVARELARRIINIPSGSNLIKKLT